MYFLYYLLQNAECTGTEVSEPSTSEPSTEELTESQTTEIEVASISVESEATGAAEDETKAETENEEAVTAEENVSSD